MTPEEKAWQQIGAQLTASGGSVQTKDEIHLSASRDVAICELSFAIGEPDYTLFDDGKSSVVSVNLQHATRLRQSILQKAFTAEL